MKISYNHLVQYIQENPTIEQVSDSLFQLGHEHEIQDNIFDMEFTPNRGDCLSINGLLRDLAVFYTVDLNQEVFSEKLNELQEARSRLYRRQNLQVDTLWKSIDEIYKIFMIFHLSLIHI